MTSVGSQAPLAALASASQRYVQIDNEGYFKLDEKRVADEDIGRAWLGCVRMDARCRAILALPGEPEAIVEAFDEPFIALRLERPSGRGESWIAQMPYGYQERFDLASLTLDEWDRFHGRTERGVPFVLSRAAQAAFFDQLDSFDDDSITADGARIELAPWLPDAPQEERPDTWSRRYREDTQGWELGAASPAIESIVPRLKLSKRRVLVLGAGSGNDAAYFARLGHIVTAVDFSADAIARAKSKYSDVANLRFVQADAFRLPDGMRAASDLIVEHTCYCAINPSRRNELVRVWRQCLVEGGHLLGVFFVIDKRDGPPFGSSEWELRARLEKGFRALYWLRSHHSLERRAGQELIVYAEKRNII